MRPGQDPDALHAAVETGDLNQIRSLVEGGAETDARDLMGQTKPRSTCAHGWETSRRWRSCWRTAPT